MSAADEYAALLGEVLAEVQARPVEAVEPVPTERKQQTPSPSAVEVSTLELSEILSQVRRFVRRFVVIGDREADAVALWIVHTYVYDTARATPYLHPWSPEPGSGKTTLLEVLALLVRAAVTVDNLTEAVLFRLIEKEHPTLLFDEVDAVFGKKNSDSTEGIRGILNSGYKKGKKAYRCVGSAHDLADFDVFCPKATAGLHELPGTLAHRSIAIAMQPPLPTDGWEDLDEDEVSSEAEALRIALQAWADTVDDVLRDPRLKPAKLPGLDARGNEIWRVLFRIADLGGHGWPDRARTAALELSGGERRHQDASAGVKLLEHIRQVFTVDRMFCGAVVDALNNLEDAPYGGWNDGRGISTRELGKKIGPYGVLAKKIRIGESRANGYELAQFSGPWSRYLAGNGLPNRDTGTTGMVEPRTEEMKEGQTELVPVSETGANPHEYSDVPVVPVSKPERGRVAPRLKASSGVLRDDRLFAFGPEKTFTITFGQRVAA